MNLMLLRMKKICCSLVACCLFFIMLSVLVSCGNESDTDPSTLPVIVNVTPNSGFAGSHVEIIGNNFVLPVTPPAGPLTNTNVVKFNGTITADNLVYQDSIGKQRINTTVPMGATSGKITVTINGVTVSSAEDFSVTLPIYLPNVQVTTAYNQSSSALAFDSKGNIYVSDVEGYKIMKITSGGVVTTLLTTTQENKPWSGIGVDANDNVYATVGQTIQKITPDGTVITFAGSTIGYADGNGTNAKFNFPWGLAVDASGNVSVSELFNHKIRKITPDGTVSTIAGGSAGYADGQGSNARFSGPQGVAVDAVGNVFVSDTGNNKIRKITPGGMVTTVSGTSNGYMDGPGATAMFNGPYGIAVDANDNIYVGQEFTIRKIASNGNVTTVAGSTPGLVDGSGASAKFAGIHGIVLATDGNIYVADTYNYKIRKIVMN